MSKILVTYFEPFDGHKENVSEVIATKLKNINLLSLPVSFSQSFEKLKNEIDNHNYDYILNFGQAEGRENICFESIAINILDARIPDNENYQPKNKKISASGENAFFSTIPAYNLAEELKGQGLPVEISYSAGTYVCNYIMYKTLEYTKDTNCQGIFIHLPLCQLQENKKNSPVLNSELQVKALETLLDNLT